MTKHHLNCAQSPIEWCFVMFYNICNITLRGDFTGKAKSGKGRTRLLSSGKIVLTGP